MHSRRVLQTEADVSQFTCSQWRAEQKIWNTGKLCETWQMLFSFLRVFFMYVDINNEHKHLQMMFGRDASSSWYSDFLFDGCQRVSLTALTDWGSRSVYTVFLFVVVYWTCCCLVTESLNTDMVKAENPEAVVATEPQGKRPALTRAMHSNIQTTCRQLAAAAQTLSVASWWQSGQWLLRFAAFHPSDSLFFDEESPAVRLTPCECSIS